MVTALISQGCSLCRSGVSRGRKCCHTRTQGTHRGHIAPYDSSQMPQSFQQRTDSHTCALLTLQYSTQLHTWKHTSSQSLHALVLTVTPLCPRCPLAALPHPDGHAHDSADRHRWVCVFQASLLASTILACEGEANPSPLRRRS